jgi:hypothetical protein
MTKEEHFANAAPENACELKCKLAGARAVNGFLEGEVARLNEVEEDVFQLEQMLDHFMRYADTDALRRSYRNYLHDKEERCSLLDVQNRR